MKKIFYFAILSAFLMAGLSALAQSGNLPSPGATPDSPFYFLKTWKEQIQTFFTFGAENKAKQYLHLSEVRLAEYQKMIEKGKTDIAQRTLDKYNEQLGRALQKIQEAKNEGKNVEDILDKVEGSLEKHIEVLRENLQKVPEPGRQGIENALENAKRAINKENDEAGEKEKGCADSGGTITTSSCCKSVSELPNLCVIGACGCAPDNSRQVKVCDCGTGKCFNGEKCVGLGAGNGQEGNNAENDKGGQNKSD